MTTCGQAAGESTETNIQRFLPESQEASRVLLLLLSMLTNNLKTWQASLVT